MELDGGTDHQSIVKDDKAAEDELDEKFGPRTGIRLTEEQATVILQRHLSKTCIKLKVIKRGFNNRSYIATTTDNLEYIIRLCGKHWVKHKTEGEVAAIVYLSKKFPEFPLPKIVGFCSDKELSLIGWEYLLMEKLAGLPLDTLWPEMILSDKQTIAVQIAQLFGKMQSLRFDKIGSFVFTPRISSTNGLNIDCNEITLDDITIGQVMEQKIGPFNNYVEFFRNVCLIEIKHLDHCQYMSPQLGNIPRIKEFLKQDFPKEITNVPFVFHHGDFEARNFLVDPENKTVTGILDLEFSGAFPIDNDFVSGGGTFGVKTEEWKVFGEKQPIEFDNEDNPDPVFIAPVRKSFLEALGRFDKSFIPENMTGHEDRAMLYYFACNICPWFFHELQNPIPEKWPEERENALRRIDKVLTMKGF